MAKVAFVTRFHTNINLKCFVIVCLYVALVIYLPKKGISLNAEWNREERKEWIYAMLNEIERGEKGMNLCYAEWNRERRERNEFMLRMQAKSCDWKLEFDFFLLKNLIFYCKVSPISIRLYSTFKRPSLRLFRFLGLSRIRIKMNHFKILCTLYTWIFI